VQSNNYWSSTTNANNPNNAWNVNMNNGNVNNDNKNNNNYVWPVRGDNDALHLFSYENIYRQYLKCRKNKRGTINALKFEVNCEENLLDLKRQLDERSYCPSRSVCFMVTRPKSREIFAADFKDRIVHHILVDYLEKIWEPRFIFDSYACRKKKGIHGAVKRLQGFMREVTQNGSRKAYFIQLDIKNFFMSIDKDILYTIIAGKVQDEKVLWLTKLLVYHDCTKDYILKGDKNYLKKIPPHKSLLYTECKKGLPIGNLTSQFFANVYLNQLDQFIKHHLKCRYYLRYCDDFVMLSEERDKLLRWKGEIEEFLKGRLKLCLNDKRQSLQSVSNGIDFVGYIVRRSYILVRRRVVNNLKSKLEVYENQLIKNNPPYQKVSYDYPILEKLRATLASYFGHFKWANSYRLQMSLVKRYRFLEKFFTFKEGKFKAIYRTPQNIPSIRLQYRYFKTKYARDVLLFQVGRYYQFYQNNDAGAQLLGLRKINTSSDRKAKCGFPIRLEKVYIRKLMKYGRSVTVIDEEDKYYTDVKVRKPKYTLQMDQ
jgi:RNA-directed DNA polymerase